MSDRQARRVALAVSDADHSLELTGTHASDAATARQFVHGVAIGRVSTRMLADMQVVAGELVLLSARPQAVGPVEIAVRVRRRRATVTLRCATGRLDHLPPRPSKWASAELAPDQLGLRIIWGMSDAVRSRTSGGVLSITAVFRNRERRRRAR
jgi:hypothetical protein